MVSGKTWSAKGVIFGKGIDGELWVQITSGKWHGAHWSTHDVSVRPMTSVKSKNRRI